MKSIASIALLFTLPLVAQEVQSTIATPVAYVYIGLYNGGTDLYDAAADGNLTLLEGSPFKTSGLAIGSNGKYFITMGTKFLHSYEIESNGAIGKQVSEINTQLYAGSCASSRGTEGLAVLDHAGENIYVSYSSIDFTSCEAGIQTFHISKTGELTFNGAAIGVVDSYYQQSPTITANDVFAYNIDFNDNSGIQTFSGFKRESSGELVNWNINISPPVTAYTPYLVVADNTNHLAAVLYDYSYSEYPLLASYTVDSQGNMTSTNNFADLPGTDNLSFVMNMSPSGKLLAIGDAGGLEVFHFNGAALPTPYSGILEDTYGIYKIHWDNDNHLYALAGPDAGGSAYLYIYTVTPTSITSVTGSPFTLNPSANALIVVPK